MVPVFRSVRCYFCVVGCVGMCICRLLEEPVVYVCFSWYVGVCMFGAEKCEARGIAEVGECWVV